MLKLLPSILSNNTSSLSAKEPFKAGGSARRKGKDKDGGIHHA